MSTDPTAKLEYLFIYLYLQCRVPQQEVVEYWGELAGEGQNVFRGNVADASTVADPLRNVAFSEQDIRDKDSLESSSHSPCPHITVNQLLLKQ